MVSYQATRLFKSININNTNQIRAAILRGMTVQDWLCDATVYGEQGTALSLDRLMIRVANLRHKALQLRWSAKGNSYHQSLAVEHLHTEAQELDLELSLWPSTVTKDYGFHVRTSSVSDNKRNAPFYGNEAYIYTSFSHAAIWNRYRAVRIIVNNILVQTITTIHRNSSVQQHTVEELQTPLAAIRDLATDLRQSIPYYFNFQPLSVDKIIPKVVTTLAWPLTVAISIKTVPDDAIQCLRSTLRSVALALGDGVLESIAQGEDFEF